MNTQNIINMNVSLGLKTDDFTELKEKITLNVNVQDAVQIPQFLALINDPKFIQKWTDTLKEMLVESLKTNKISVETGVVKNVEEKPKSNPFHSADLNEMHKRYKAMNPANFYSTNYPPYVPTRDQIPRRPITRTISHEEEIGNEIDREVLENMLRSTNRTSR